VSGEKTEDPTERRRVEARRKGEGVGRSHELAQVLTLVAGLITLSALLPGVVARIEDSLRTHVEAIGDGPALTPVSLLGNVGEAFQMTVLLVLPLGVAVMIAGVFGGLASGGFIVSTRAMGWQWNRMNPSTGIKRIFDKTALSRLA
jgi:flagellar biosynthetic protein FlhB